MRTRILSDLHLEFGWEKQRSFINSLDPEGVDVLILAGDICLHKQMVEALTALCQRFSEAIVIWVHGNHEFYLSNRQEVLERTQAALAQNPNLRWLDCDVIEVKGQRFVGTPLWFRWHDINPQIEWFMNDFRVIDGFKSWVYQENTRALGFLRHTLREGDIVITHHLPSPRSIAPRFANSDLNNFFLCDVTELIELGRPRLWIHGHTHDSFDYIIPHRDGDTTTRVICNPRGYFPNDLNPDFDPTLTVET